MTDAGALTVLDGILHVHSTYSDGEFPLSELRRALLRDGYRFACLADHAEAFDAPKVADYVKECAELSDEAFCLVAGLEFECERRLHIVGFGCTKLAATGDPEAVISHIADAGGVSVVAHPPDAQFSWLESFRVLPQGLEVWNSKYDGRSGPRAATFELLRRWRRRDETVRAFYGVDLHWTRQFRGLACRIHGAVPKPATILAALDQGQYAGRLRDIELPASGEVSPEWLDRADRRNRRSARLRRALKSGKRLLDRLGVKVPKGIKAQIRRMT